MNLKKNQLFCTIFLLFAFTAKGVEGKILILGNNYILVTELITIIQNLTPGNGIALLTIFKKA